MTLYKYVHPARVDVLENLEIRFTQPDALNDPFELRPHIDSLIEQTDVLANMPDLPVDLRPMIKQAYDMLPELKAVPLEFAMESLEQLMATEEARQATAEGLGIFLKLMQEGASPIPDKIYRAVSENAGLLSLSEMADNALMWAHYADSHRGLVLCFDENNLFFNRRRTENDDFYFLRKVNYTDGPALSLATIHGEALLVTKGTQWDYEREWRMLVPLQDNSRLLTINGDSIYLFSFPADALRGVILGGNASVETTKATERLLDRSEFKHVQLSKTIFDLDTRTVKFDEARRLPKT
jgi:hypothetical protein